MGDQRTVLVVDDSPSMRCWMQRCLEACGRRAVVAAGAREALDVLARETVHVVLSDLNMDDLDGIELVRAIRRTDPKVPIVLVTTESAPERIAEARRAGASGWATKPISEARLRAIVEQMEQRA